MAETSNQTGKYYGYTMKMEHVKPLYDYVKYLYDHPNISQDEKAHLKQKLIEDTSKNGENPITDLVINIHYEGYRSLKNGTRILNEPNQKFIIYFIEQLGLENDIDGLNKIKPILQDYFNKFNKTQAGPKVMNKLTECLGENKQVYKPSNEYINNTGYEDNNWIVLDENRAIRCVTDTLLKNRFISINKNVYSFFRINDALIENRSLYFVLYDKQYKFNLQHAKMNNSEQLRLYFAVDTLKEIIDIDNPRIKEQGILFEKIWGDRFKVTVGNIDDLKTINTPFEFTKSYNRILYGAPGTGKSYLLNQQLKSFLAGLPEEHCERVTFHPDYAYANFVGTYKPVPDVENGKSIITYKYVPGPFMRIYSQALQHPELPYVLVIEEINRAVVAGVFGDIFQLLDRTEDGRSEYPIQASEDIRSYLSKELGEETKIRNLALPSNLFIWATMNSADQGVFPMDTAFKRRWEFEYLDINCGDWLISGKKVTIPNGDNLTVTIEWNKLRQEINKKLISFGINEDKLMGPFFISLKSILKNGEIEPNAFMKVFKNKVIMYLFEDAAKQNRGKLFAGCSGDIAKTYSNICKEFDRNGIRIFHQDIRVAFDIE